MTSNHQVAKFFLAGGEDIEELDGVAVLPDTFSDIEKKFSSDVSDTEQRTHFVKDVVTRIEDLASHQEVHQIHLVMPAEILHKVTSHLSAQEQARIGKTVDAEMMKASPLEVVRRLFSAE